MKRSLFLLCLLASFYCYSQEVQKNLDVAISRLEADSQCRHGLVSLFVIDSKTGKKIYDKNSGIGLAPASCQKVITSLSAFDILGKGYTYTTTISIDGVISGGVLNGNLYINGAGDPTTGSWRYKQTRDDVQFQSILRMLMQQGITQINGNIIVLADGWDTQATPGGWTWDDMGNYYGAGPWALNWYENQYDVVIAPGKRIGDAAHLIKTIPKLNNVRLINELTTGSEGSGDNTIIYLPERSSTGYIRGTVPAGENEFTISGSIPDPPSQFLFLLQDFLIQNKIQCKCRLVNTEDSAVNSAKLTNTLQVIGKITSPPLDSINYWFLKKSVNLYGEALVKTIGHVKKNVGSTDSGLNVIKDLWEKKGIERSAMRMIDGSGLSPANKITTSTLVTVMQYARQQIWYSSFYNALPEINGIKMKSGSIGGVLSYTGYIKSKAGDDYTFSFIINNFNGSGATLKTKMWELLDLMK